MNSLDNFLGYSVTNSRDTQPTAVGRVNCQYRQEMCYNDIYRMLFINALKFFNYLAISALNLNITDESFVDE